jgi:hypothetical protein
VGPHDNGVGAGEQVIIVYVGENGPTEVARHLRAAPGSLRIDEPRFRSTLSGALDREPGPRTVPERDFLALGDEARLWLIEAAPGGASSWSAVGRRRVGTLAGRQCLESGSE